MIYCGLSAEKPSLSENSQMLMREVVIEIKLNYLQAMQFYSAEIIVEAFCYFFEGLSFLRSLLVLMIIFANIRKAHVIVVNFAAKEEAHSRQHRSVHICECHMLDVQMENCHGYSLGLRMDFEMT